AAARALAHRHPVARKHGDVGVRALAVAQAAAERADGQFAHREKCVSAMFIGKNLLRRFFRDRGTFAAAKGATFAAWARRKLIEPIIELLRQGVTPDKIALSLAFGLGLGIFPVLGVSTVLCTVAAIAFRLNLPAIQLVNYLASPVQLLL